MRAEDLSYDIGEALRLGRHRRRMSQRDFAAFLAMPHSRIARLETNAAAQPVPKILTALEGAGFSLAVVDEEEHLGRPCYAGMPVTDAAGRRFPAHHEVIWQDMPPTWWFARNGGWLTRQERPHWTWQRRYE